MKHLRPALAAIAMFTIALGLVYPLVIQLAAMVIPHPAPAELVGQTFDDPADFWGRPSALPPGSAMTSSGTNAGPSGFVDKHGTLGPNPALVDAVRARVQALRAADPTNTAKIPVDLVTASASGLDPHISPEAAYYQVPRVARARGLPEATVRAIVDAHVEGRTLAILGARRVHVARLNHALEVVLVTTRR